MTEHTAQDFFLQPWTIMIALSEKTFVDILKDSKYNLILFLKWVKLPDYSRDQQGNMFSSLFKSFSYRNKERIIFMRTLRKSCLISHLKGALELVGSTNSCVFFFSIFVYLFGYTGSQFRHANSQLQYVGSSSLTRDRTCTHCLGSVESQPLDHQGRPHKFFQS